MNKLNTQIAEYMLSLYPEFDDYNTLEKHLEENCNISAEHFLTEFRRDCFKEYDESADENKALTEVVKILERHNLRFRSYFAGFIADSYGKIFSVAESSGICACPYELTADIVCQIYSALYNIAIRTLIFELEQAKKSNLLLGETSDERFEYYAEKLLNDENYVKKLHDEYRVMYSNLCRTAEETAEFTVEILRNTVKDLSEISNKLQEGKHTGRLVNITLSGGDTHCGCRSVSILRFENTKLVYKPHSLAGEVSFARLTEFTNSFISDSLTLRHLKILDKGDYGWTEFIEHLPLENEKDASVFYRKTGRLLALLYLCGASDLHFENVIAVGNDLVPIDMETIFHCVPYELLNSTCKSSGYTVLKRFLNSSVHGTGLLPSYVSFRDSSGAQKNFSVGGMSGSSAQESPFTSYSFDNMGKDNVSMVKEKFSIGSSENSPVLNGAELDPRRYADDIAKGFSEVYRIILDNRDKFREKVISLFENTRNRIVLKATLAYGNLLSIGTHPDFQRNDVFARLLYSRTGLLKPAGRFLSYEISALIRRNIPIYYADFTKRQLTAGDGTIYEDILEKTPMEEFLEKLSGFSEKDLKLQTDFIKTGYFEINAVKDHTDISIETEENHKADRDELISTAVEIGDYLLENRSVTGINHKGMPDRFFYGCNVERCENNDFTTVMNDFYLYDGACGIALFLHELGRLSGENRFTEASMETIEPIISIIEADTFNYEHRCGAFTGTAGYFYILNRFAELDDNDSLRNLMKDKLCRVTEFALKDETGSSDIIGGTAGALAVLVNIAETTSDKELSEMAVQQAEKCYGILYSATMKNGIPDSDALGYSGFAHGISGIIPYACKLFFLTERADILDYTKALLEYERKNFRIEENGRITGWLSAKSNGGVVSSWCHGTPGFLLEKIMLKKAGYCDDELDRELHSASEITAKECIGTSLSYCHGDMGNLAILKMYAKLCGNEELSEKCRSAYNELYSRYIKNITGNSDVMCQKYNGLMIGLAGTGYSCLENADESLTQFIMLA